VSARRGDFTLHAGDVFLPAASVTALLGGNGSGKTTALRLMAGLDAPAHGTVHVHGTSMHARSESARARTLAYVPQRPVVGAPFTVEQVVALGRHALPDDPGRVLASLELVKLSHRAQDAFHALSTGQQQRVALARALAQHEPHGVVVLDEAFAAIDLPLTLHLVHVVRGLAARGATVVMATHDLALAAAVADHAWYLAGGATAAFGPASEVLRADRMADLAGVPVVSAPGHARPLPVPDLSAMLTRER
jgi:iron complex transport system ATP-binding protein